MLKDRKELRITVTFRIPEWVISEMKNHISPRERSRYVEALVVKDLNLKKTK